MSRDSVRWCMQSALQAYQADLQKELSMSIIEEAFSELRRYVSPGDQADDAHHYGHYREAPVAKPHRHQVKFLPQHAQASQSQLNLASLKQEAQKESVASQTTKKPDLRMVIVAKKVPRFVRPVPWGSENSNEH